MKKRNKVSAEFSMSSLTDIIFLLLIFFMLTSSVVVPNALNLKMPGGSSSSVTLDSRPTNVQIKGKSTFYIGSKKYSKQQLEAHLRSLARRSGGKKLDMTLSPSKTATHEAVVTVMEIMRKAKINCILTVEE